MSRGRPVGCGWGGRAYTSIMRVMLSPLSRIRPAPGDACEGGRCSGAEPGGAGGRAGGVCGAHPAPSPSSSSLTPPSRPLARGSCTRQSPARSARRSAPAQGSGERGAGGSGASERVGGGTHDDAPPDPQVRLLVQPDLDLRLALQVAEDQVLRAAPRVSQAKLALGAGAGAGKGARSAAS